MNMYNLTTQVKCIIDDDFSNYDASFISKHEFDSLDEFKEYILALDISNVLGTEKNLCCIFHNDTKPSACIYDYEKKYYYKCFAECTHNDAVNLIEIIKIIKNIGYHQAILFLAKLFKCQLNFNIEGAKIINSNILKIIDNNIEILGQIKNKAPAAYKRLKTPLNLLYAIFELAKNGDSNSYSENAFDITFSNVFIEKSFNLFKNSNSLAILHFFGLIQRLPAYQIKPDRLQQLFEVSHKESLRTTHVMNCTRIYQYDNSIFDLLEKKAEEFEIILKNSNIKIRNFSFQNITEKNPLVAMKLFPQA